MLNREVSSFGETRKFNGRTFYLYQEVVTLKKPVPTPEDVELAKQEAKEQYKYVRKVKNAYDQVAIYVSEELGAESQETDVVADAISTPVLYNEEVPQTPSNPLKLEWYYINKPLYTGVKALARAIKQYKKTIISFSTLQKIASQVKPELGKFFLKTYSDYELFISLCTEAVQAV